MSDSIDHTKPHLKIVVYSDEDRRWQFQITQDGEEFVMSFKRYDDDDMTDAYTGNYVRSEQSCYHDILLFIPDYVQSVEVTEYGLATDRAYVNRFIAKGCEDIKYFESAK